jgi:hypothetical protein
MNVCRKVFKHIVMDVHQCDTWGEEYNILSKYVFAYTVLRMYL